MLLTHYMYVKWMSNVRLMVMWRRMEDSGEDDGCNMSMFYHPHCDE